VFAVLRVVVLAVAIALAFTTIAWLVTGDRKWLRLAWRIFKYAVFALAALLVLFAAEALLG
jgi:hypothetical protein